MLKNKKLLLILVIALLFGLWRYRVSTSNTKGATVSVARGEVREELVLSGEIKAEEHALLNFLTSGELNYVGVREGEYVEKGQVLARLDSTNAYQTYLQAEADLRRYQASLGSTYDQLQGHSKDESFTQIESRTVAETNKDKAYRNLVIAQKNLSNLSLKAPFNGIVASVTHPYNGVNTGITESQIEIVNPSTLYFEVTADQSDVINLKEGQKVAILLDTFSGEELKCYVVFIGYTPKVGEVGNVYKVKINFESLPTEKVKIGMSGDAKFILSERNDVLFIPPNFIKSDANGKYINLAPKNNKKYIEIGVEGEDRVEIMGDIKEGELVYD